MADESPSDVSLVDYSKHSTSLVEKTPSLNNTKVSTAQNIVSSLRRPRKNILYSKLFKTGIKFVMNGKPHGIQIQNPGNKDERSSKSINKIGIRKITRMKKTAKNLISHSEKPNNVIILPVPLKMNGLMARITVFKSPYSNLN